MLDEEIKIYKRNLPHWTSARALYFVTYRLMNGELTDEEKDIVYNHLVEGKDIHYNLHSFIIMPNHIHIIFQCKDGITLSKTMQGIKGVSAYRINRYRGTKGTIWRDESYDRIIRDEKEYYEKLVYILNNPLKLGLVENPEVYKWYYFNEGLEWW